MDVDLSRFLCDPRRHNYKYISYAGAICVATLILLGQKGSSIKSLDSGRLANTVDWIAPTRQDATEGLFYAITAANTVGMRSDSGDIVTIDEVIKLDMSNPWQDINNSLRNGWPVVASIKVGSNWDRYNWFSQLRRSSRLQPIGRDFFSMRVHTVCIVGLNTATGHYKIHGCMNDGWGQKGFAIIESNVIRNVVDMYSIVG